MRIAVNTRFLLPGRLEGIGWYTHEIVRRMVAAHPEDTFIFLFDRPYDPDFLYGPNVEPRVIFPPARHPLLWYAWFEGRLPGVLQRSGANVFFSPDAYLSLRSRVPTVMTVHDLLPLEYPEQVPWAPRRYYRHFLPRYIRRADAVIAVSEHTRQGILRAGLAGPERVSVVYNGCREGFRPLSDAERSAVKAQYAQGQDYFFYSGAIHPRKNVHRLIRAFDRFKSETGAPVRLLLAGRMAWQTETVQAALQQARYRDDIRLLGYVPEPELPRLLGAALALTYVSLGEGFGLPVLEAMHCETPVLTSDRSALPEVAGDAALLVDPEDEQAICAGMKKLYADEGFRQGLTVKMRAQRQKFTWDAAAEAIYTLLKHTSSTHQRP